MKSKKVLLTVEPTKKAMNRAFSELTKPSKRYRDIEIISFPDFETLGKVITGMRLEVMNAIRVHKPKSIHDLAKILERDFKNVHQDVELLAQFGLIELKKNGSRQASTLKAKFSELVLAA